MILEGGQYLSGRIDLKSGVELHLERDGMLLMSPNVNDFPEIESDFWDTEYAPRFNKRCFIYAENCIDIGITGRGVIDCHVQNVYFDNCHFRQLRYEDIPTPFAARYAASGSPLNPPDFRCVDQLVFNSTTFSTI